jgi:retron-type reverse transcriptase
MEAGNVRYSENGAPQGGVISPLLSNIYLHEVPDDWFVTAVQPRLEVKSFMARYADDAVIGCEKKSDQRSADAGRIMKGKSLPNLRSMG